MCCLQTEELILEHDYPSSTSHHRVVSLLSEDWRRASSLTPALNNLTRLAEKGQFWAHISLSENNYIDHHFPSPGRLQHLCSHPQTQQAISKCHQQIAPFKRRRSPYLPLWFWLYFHCCKTNLNSLVILYSPLHPNRGSYDTTTSVGQWKLEKIGKRNRTQSFFITVDFSREVVCAMVSCLISKGRTSGYCFNN